MKVFDANITHQVWDFLNENLKAISAYNVANQKIFKVSGIRYFFDNQLDFETLKKTISEVTDIVEEPERGEYGDFQTNTILALKTATFLKQKLYDPKIIVEPTCGKGNFIIAAMATFGNIEKVYGVEIYKPYVWETKFNILQFFLSNPSAKKPEIEIAHFNVFDFDFNLVAQQYLTSEILIIGNPPWVTNSKLSSLESENLPTKSNFKKHSGLDAITGKGNFDIGEYITLMMFDAFQNSNGHFAFLLKNSVIKNVVFDQKQRSYNISDLEKYSIDSKREFNVSVEASLLTCKLNTQPEYDCKEFDFYNNLNYSNIFGWVDNKFVSNFEYYKLTHDIDGVCPFEWRQGVKHDCSSIMELNRVNGHFVNGLNQEITLEEDLVYGLLKSSDLKETVIEKARKFTIITQKKVGQETSYIETKYPKTFYYLNQNKAQFDARKSSIYKAKPAFSIFGIGDYSFKPYKIAISGLYKSFNFNLILPQSNKPVMLDDTCYFLGFDQLEQAVYVLLLLNSKKTKDFLQSIAFSDAKRTFTKDILMRIDLLKLALPFTQNDIQNDIEKFNTSYKLNIQSDNWDEFVKSMTPINTDILVRNHYPGCVSGNCLVVDGLRNLGK